MAATGPSTRTIARIFLPVVLLVYCLPLHLQFPLFTLTLTLWVSR